MGVQAGHVAEVAQLLASGRGTPKEKLVTCGKMIWSATVLARDWPPDLLEKANHIKRALMKDGTVEKTVKQMSESAASECLKQLTSDTAELAAEIAESLKQDHFPRN
jgi:uncharacterized membrane-anchored protein YjiN (DUF445 family)